MKEIEIEEGKTIWMSEDEKFWTEVKEAREQDIKTLQKTIMYNEAILEMAIQKLNQIKENQK